MPTGYTAEIAKDISFEQFVWNCARGMGALIMMRDEPSDAPIPERFEPSDYYSKELESKRAERERIAGLSEYAAECEARAEYDSALSRHHEYIVSKGELRGKYEAMLAKVQAWQPPTQDHVNFKDFMSKQIAKSIDFDCNGSFCKPPELLSPSAWRSKKIADLDKHIAIYSEEHAKEVERTEGRNRWIAALRESLKDQLQ